ncbi:MAG: hypothetical protein KDB07_13715 [Planctomycetes bacterium]|nr:hypothetical protein [Planctomycetota bacterium]
MHAFTLKLEYVRDQSGGISDSRAVSDPFELAIMLPRSQIWESGCYLTFEGFEKNAEPILSIGNDGRCGGHCRVIRKVFPATERTNGKHMELIWCRCDETCQSEEGEMD